MNERWQSQRATLVWWLLAAGLATALKIHFSAVGASGLGWVLRPVSLLLQWVAGWRFERNDAGEWFSLEAGIVLVKACAGINFMILSFLGWCWLARPRRRVNPRHAAVEWPLLLASSLVFAWVVALAINTLRILVIVYWQPLLDHWLPAGDAHRLLGVLIYVTALNLQLLLFDRRWQQMVLLGCGLYALIMLVIPLLTGNAGMNIRLYLRHALLSLSVLLPFVVLAAYPFRKRHATSELSRHP